MKQKFERHRYLIDLYFETLLESDKAVESAEPTLEVDELIK